MKSLSAFVAIAAALAAGACAAAPLPYSSLTPRGAIHDSDYLGDQPVGYLGTQYIRATALRDYVLTNVKTFGAVCDGITDDHVAIQAAITAAQASSPAGGVVSFPLATCYLGTVGLTITGNGVRLVGQAGSGGVSGGLVGTILTYNGTGSAITVGVTDVLNYNDAIDQILIKANSAAAASATAVGLTMNNAQYFTSHNLGINGFAAGVGLLSQANGASGFSATNTFYDVNFYANHIGVRSTTINSGIGENILGIHGGWIIGDLSAGSIGLDLQANSNGGVFENIDIESFAIGIKDAGVDVRFMGTHTEFDTQHITLTNTSTHNVFFGHMPASVGSFAAVWADAGTDNHFNGSQSGSTPTVIGKNVFSPSVDGTETIVVNNFAQLALIDTDTRDASRALELANGTNLKCYSDNFSTQTCRMNSATGDFSATTGAFTSTTVTGLAQSQQLTVRPAADGTNFLNVYNTGGDPIFNCFASATHTLSTCNMSYGASLNGYVDNAGVTQTFNLNSDTGALLSRGLGGVGYATGAGGTITQITSKSTGVILNKTTGQITMNNASLGASTSVMFRLTNSTITGSDTVVVNIASGATSLAYVTAVEAVGTGSADIVVRNVSGSPLSEALVLNFAVIKGAIS